jgi:dephospho-CoA kinase
VASPLIVALTGGIAAGKSAAADRFARHDVPVFDADLIAREVVAPGQPALGKIIAAFGTGALTETGELDRARMRECVFADVAARRRLEAIVHPHVRAGLLERTQACRAPYCVLAIPLLIEAWNDYRWVHRVLVVDIPGDVQLARLLRRPGIDDALARNILAAQASRSTRLAAADDVIDTSAPIVGLDAAVARLDARYTALAAERAGSALRPER